MISRIFLQIREKNPNWGDFICLCEAIRGRKFAKDAIKKAFKLWVKDCSPKGKEKEVYLEYLYAQSMRPL